jgi:GT2 family glycosyltransferase
VLDRLAQQTTPPTAVVAVDTGVPSSAVDLLRTTLPDGSEVLALPGAAYPAAVRAGLAALDPAGADDWIWLLHDDSAPAPDALDRLLTARTGSDVLGPKIREWPSLRRLLEVGVTMSGTGRRETWLERGEYDQGQHDEPRDVLAVNTAGMLVRRAVLEELGLDDELPVVHTDVDLGWRAARAGYRVRTVPDAVVFHAEASRTGTRRPDQSRAARRRLEREAALYTLLANCAAAAVPLVAVRQLIGTVLRAVGLLLVRAPAESWAELQALGATLLRPGRLLRARRARRATARVGPRAVRHLLAPAWLPYRHGLDEVAGIAAAVVGEAGARTGTADGGPSLARRARRSPVVWVLLGLTLLSLLAARELYGGGRLAGGALLPAPGSAGDWWSTYLSSTHDVSTGSTVTAPAYLLPLAVLATVLAGSATLAVDLLVLAAVPVAGVGALRLLRHAAVSTLPAVVGAVGYAVLLATSGALAQGRVGTLVAGALLPWLASTTLGLLADSADRRRRAAWRTALWLALIAAFAPVVLPMAAVVALVGAVAGVLSGRITAAAAGLALLPVPVAVVLLLPWSALAGTDHGWSALLLEGGLPASSLVGPMQPTDLLGARAGDTAAAPVWMAAATGLVALLALLRGRTRSRVVACWAVALVGLAGVWVLNGLELDDPVGRGTVLVWAGVPLLLVHGAWIAAASVASSGLRSSLAGRSFGWRQPAGVAVAALALVLPVCGATWWLSHGSQGPLARVDVTTVPAYMDAAADRDPADGTLVLRGSLDEGVTAEVRRGAPLTLGEEVLVVRDAAQDRFTGTVSDLLTAPVPETRSELAQSGVAFVMAPSPVDPELAAALDAVPTLESASADDPSARAWRLGEESSLPSPEVGARSWLRTLLVGGQAAALLAVVVLAAPTRRREP